MSEQALLTIAHNRKAVAGSEIPVFRGEIAPIDYTPPPPDGDESNTLALAQAALRESEERFRSLYDTMTQGVVYYDAMGVLFSANAAARRMLGLSLNEMAGEHTAAQNWKVVREDGAEYPAEEQPPLRALYSGLPVHGVVLGVFDPGMRQRRWLRVDAIPQFRPGEERPYQVYSTFDDITDVRQAEIEKAKAEEKARASHAHTVEVLESIGDAFYAVDSEFRFTYVNGKAERLWGIPREELLGRRLQDVFPQFVGSPSLARQLQSMAERTPCSYDAPSPVFGRWIEISVYPSGDGLSIYYRDVTGRKAAEDAQHQSEARFRQMANTVPNILWTADPDGSRDYYNQRWYDYTGLTFEETRDWDWLSVVHEDDAPTMAASYRAAVARATEYSDEFRLRQANGEYRWHMARGAPIRNEAGDVIKWVGACTDITAHKHAEAMQAALFQREHTIAKQLQDALQRPLPCTIPGMAVTEYYEAALTEEAGVGGDFHDVFTIENGHTILSVGDVSGKGLAAAAQVATVRNMLRAYLYSKPTVVEAVNTLNRDLAANNLLTGFATLFVALYDSHSRVLNYVNCGQEPALLRRAATGAIERLTPTGAILGCVADEQYAERAVTLAPGDTLAIFSDGLTEVGPSSREMLGIEGVEALLVRPLPEPEIHDPAEVAKYLAKSLIEGVKAAATGGVMRDDVCLLIAVAE